MTDVKVAMVSVAGSVMGAHAANRLAQDGFKLGILSLSGDGEVRGTKLGGFGVNGSDLKNDDLQMLVDSAAN